MKTQVERRQARRRPIMEAFHLSAVIGKFGPQRLRIFDLSDLGIALQTQETLETGELVEVRLYLNQSLYLPLQARVVRVEMLAGMTGAFKLGAEFLDRESSARDAFLAFLDFLDQLVDAGKIDPGTG